jgi:hypothetical protein
MLVGLLLWRYVDQVSAEINCGDGFEICSSYAPSPFSFFTGSRKSSQCCACAVGRYSAGDSKSCADCPLGSFNSAAGGMNCVLCAPGEYAPVSGSVECLYCPMGKYQSLRGQSACDMVPPGFRSAALMGASRVDMCPKDKFSLPGASECKQCPANSTSVAGSSECISTISVGGIFVERARTPRHRVVKHTRLEEIEMLNSGKNRNKFHRSVNNATTAVLINSVENGQTRRTSLSKMRTSFVKWLYCDGIVAIAVCILSAIICLIAHLVQGLVRFAREFMYLLHHHEESAAGVSYISEVAPYEDSPKRQELRSSADNGVNAGERNIAERENVRVSPDSYSGRLCSDRDTLGPLVGKAGCDSESSVSDGETRIPPITLGSPNDTFSAEMIRANEVPRLLSATTTTESLWLRTDEKPGSPSSGSDSVISNSEVIQLSPMRGTSDMDILFLASSHEKQASSIPSDGKVLFKSSCADDKSVDSHNVCPSPMDDEATVRSARTDSHSDDTLTQVGLLPKSAKSHVLGYNPRLRGRQRDLPSNAFGDVPCILTGTSPFGPRSNICQSSIKALLLPPTPSPIVSKRSAPLLKEEVARSGSCLVHPLMPISEISMGAPSRGIVAAYYVSDDDKDDDTEDDTETVVSPLDGLEDNENVNTGTGLYEIWRDSPGVRRNRSRA